MIHFKISEIRRSLHLFAKTGDLEHMGDVWRIAVWQGSSAE